MTQNVPFSEKTFLFLFVLKKYILNICLAWIVFRQSIHFEFYHLNYIKQTNLIQLQGLYYILHKIGSFLSPLYYK